MGTESEALRWKQWIDRWIKVAAVPKADSNISTPVLSMLKSPITTESGTSGPRKSLLTPEQLQYQLINMIKVESVVQCDGRTEPF